MLTERLEIKAELYDESINRAAEIIKNGGTVAIPTETVYGLAASCYDDTAIKSIFSAKGRPQDNPLIVHIADIDDLSKVVESIPDEAYECAKRFWPGPLTMVLKRNDKIADSVCAGLDTVAVRMPDNDIARDIIRKSYPVAAPSANLSGRPSPTSAQHVIDDLDGKIGAVIMAEDCSVGVESTVITLSGETPRILRPGAVTLEQLREVLPNITVDKAVLTELKEGEKASSPGMKYKHYAPKTEAFLVEGDIQQFAEFVNSQKECCAVCFEEECAIIKVKKIPYGKMSDESTLANRLFSVLRSVDEVGAEKIFIHAPSKNGVGLAVYNRLVRAAAFRVIKL